MTEQPLTVEDCVQAARNLLRGYGSLNLRSEGVRAELATALELANTWLRMGELITRAPAMPTDDATVTARVLAATAVQKLIDDQQEKWPTDPDEPLMSEEVEVQVRAALARIVRSILH